MKNPFKKRPPAERAEHHATAAGTAEPRRDNPYLSAKEEYSDRYGSAVKTARSWKRICFVLTLLCLIFGITMAVMSGRNRVVPYVVQVDKQGYTVAVKPADETTLVDERVIIATLGRYVKNLRTRFADAASQRALIDEVYNYTASGSTAQKTVNEYYRQNNPFSAVVKEGAQTDVELINILNLGKGQGRQVRWREKDYKTGKETAWRALVKYGFSPAKDQETIMKNPLGIYITELSISQDLE